MHMHTFLFAVLRILVIIAARVMSLIYGSIQLALQPVAFHGSFVKLLR